VILDYDWRNEDLSHLLAHDSDPFNRWEAGQRLASRLILAAAEDLAAGRPAHWPQSFAAAAHRFCGQASADPAFAAEVLTLPGEATLAEEIATVDPDALHAARNGLRRFLAERLDSEGCGSATTSLAPTEPYQPTPAAAGRRALRNLCLGYLNELDDPETRTLALQQFASADNMTDQFAALGTLAQQDCRERAAGPGRILRALAGRSAGGGQVAVGAGVEPAARNAGGGAAPAELTRRSTCTIRTRFTR
jgi:aminopeptidase N